MVRQDKNGVDFGLWKKISPADLICPVDLHVARVAKRFGLISQLRRAAVSVPSNIAEGQGRGNDGHFIQFLGMSRGSLHEVETQLILSARLGFLSTELQSALLAQTKEVGRLTSALINSLDRAVIRESPNKKRPVSIV